MDENIIRLELEEVLETGKQTLHSLYSAQIKLNSAKNWKILDKFNGTFFTNMMKYSKKEEAREHLELARQDVQKFQRRIRAAKLPKEIKMEMGAFVAFSAFFLDGPIADYVLCAGMEDAAEQINDAILLVEQILQILPSRGGALKISYVGY